ncbi:hypothetical protein [Mesorhizobium dulcispinae]|uniref:hypothetical protein n=1 Tax=Mesorhizobium dulcispinae TaxID=3072316 RepID=UPI002A248675|nr:hypothetical protein [Mesorhizobium sp. VK23D]MDX8517966.1 hypothetical protein [Mesorhizobium sp. VK23D]
MLLTTGKHEMKPTIAERLHDIADRLARLTPSHRDPHRYHEDKSELIDALRRLASEAPQSATQAR